jgi:hypothetical protein
MEFVQQTAAGKFRRYRKWAVLFGLLFAAAAGLVILLAYSPKSYQPVQPENPREVSPYLTHRLGPDFYDKVQLDKPFELLIEQEGINDILSRYPWPVRIEGFSIYTPVLLFSPEQTRLMAQVDYGGLSSILSIYAKPYLNSDGKLNLNIQSVYLGLLPITSLARKIAEKFVQANFDPQDPIESVNYAIVANQPFDPVLRIYDKSARITNLTIESGKIRLFLVPIQ